MSFVAFPCFTTDHPWIIQCPNPLCVLRPDRRLGPEHHGRHGPEPGAGCLLELHKVPESHLIYPNPSLLININKYGRTNLVLCQLCKSCVSLYWKLQSLQIQDLLIWTHFEALRMYSDGLSAEFSFTAGRRQWLLYRVDLNPLLNSFIYLRLFAYCDRLPYRFKENRCRNATVWAKRVFVILEYERPTEHIPAHRLHCCVSCIKSKIESKSLIACHPKREHWIK